MKDQTITVVKFRAGMFGVAGFDARSWHDPRISSYVELSHVEPEQKRGKPA
jgi:hypothetical protein